MDLSFKNPCEVDTTTVCPTNQVLIRPGLFPNLKQAELHNPLLTLKTVVDKRLGLGTRTAWLRLAKGCLLLTISRHVRQRMKLSLLSGKAHVG